MIIFPAVDIIGGRAVRLVRGNYESAKVYADTAEKAAEDFKASGARYIHAVDLDGAERGKAVNGRVIENIIKITGAFTEVGGGIRTESQADEYLSAGAGRVIIGTAAVRDFALVKTLSRRYPFKIAVGVDAADGKVAVCGWKKITDINAFEFCKRLAGEGIDNVIYTDIARDGTLRGVNPNIYEKLSKIQGLKITASGGISGLEDIRKLKAAGVYAAVIGKAFYENALTLKEAAEAAED